MKKKIIHYSICGLGPARQAELSEMEWAEEKKKGPCRG